MMVRRIPVRVQQVPRMPVDWATEPTSAIATDNFNGVVDDVRVSNTDRAVGWIVTDCDKQNSPSTFETFGTRE